MIARMRRRVTLLVILFIVLVTAGIVAAISIANYRGVERQAMTALETLTRRSGRPLRTTAQEAESTPPPKPDDDEDGEQEETGFFARFRRRGASGTGDGSPFGRQRPVPGQPMDMGDTAASLSSSYTIRLDGAGKVSSWSSDREELYSGEQVQALADEILASGQNRGRIGTQFFILSQREGSRTAVVLDARLEMESVRRVTLIAAATGALACFILGVAAFFLIRRMVAPVEEAFRRQRQFVWDASHELKTPLAVISANAQVLEDDVGENENLGYIRQEVERTDKLVQGLLSLARMENGTVKAERRPFDLSRTLLSAALPFESTVFEAGKNLETDIPEGVRAVGDEAMIRQLALILLDNALKYSEDGGTIRLTLKPRRKGAVFSVANTGPGIDAADLPHIFERFYRAEKSHSRETGGSGLGLAIAKELAEANGARIRAESREGLTTFTVTIG